MPADPYTDVDYKAEQVLIAHTRTRIEGCHCGWGMDGSKLAQSHALHVWRELQRAVLPDHDARVRAEERARVAKQITDWAGYGYGADWEQGYRAAMHAAEIARGNTTTEEEHR